MAFIELMRFPGIIVCLRPFIKAVYDRFRRFFLLLETDELDELDEDDEDYDSPAFLVFFPFSTAEVCF